MTVMTDEAAAAFADSILAKQAAWIRRHRPRYQTIMTSDEATGRGNLAFALALRFDLPAGRAIALLKEAPELDGVEAILAWVDSIPTRPPLEIVSQ
ncbi:MAG: hypothetical protein Q7T93_04310 [Methylobacterium sp.]|uniref:hypothetical protein n=1 Tax=Methylobacterium sp. TaxID=409 RepID=UPI0027262A14|nr:hypothetical protein [Methylobacterium sp.]MDO9426033.1 hypothetical protein [Methylobacterium sp.]